MVNLLVYSVVVIGGCHADVLVVVFRRNAGCCGAFRTLVVRLVHLVGLLGSFKHLP